MAMKEITSSVGSVIWTRYLKAFKEFVTIEYNFLTEDIDRVMLLKHALHGEDWRAALFLIKSIKLDELQDILEDLIYLIYNRDSAYLEVCDLILKIPKDYLLSHIKDFIEPYFANATYYEYRKFLELFIKIDADLTEQLARKAIESKDYDMREAAEEYLEKLGKKPNIS